MSADQSPAAVATNTGYELFVGALSVLSLVNLVLVLLIPDPATRNIIYSIDVVLSVVFMIDFLVRLRRAPSRSNYFFRQFGWADLLGSLPLPQVKILRIFRVFRVVRILRRSRPRDIARSLVRDRASSSLLTLLLVGILVLEFGSLTMLQLERNAPNANITTAPDALWYLVVTMSTVGYGDRYPVSTAGRALGTFVIVVGVGIFGTLTGYLANLFISPRKEQLAPNTPPTLADARHRLEQVKELLNQQQAAVAELEAMLRGGDV